jgi:nucleoid-associated protein YgaU
MAENEDFKPQTTKHKSHHRYPSEQIQSQQIKDLKPTRSSTKVIAEHTVVGGDTLSHISLNYYGSASKPYWMVIYQANQDLIGDNPNKLKRGLTLKIPKLPAELKE